jgi:hypothetical protein
VGPGKAVLLEGDGLLKVDPVLRIADEALSVASAVAVARPLTPSVRTVDPSGATTGDHEFQQVTPLDCIRPHPGLLECQRDALGQIGCIIDRRIGSPLVMTKVRLLALVIDASAG